MQLRNFRSIFLACLLVAACGDSDTTGGGGSGGSGATGAGGALGGGGAGNGGTGGRDAATLEDAYCRPLAETICDRAAACNCGLVSPSGSFDEPACVVGYTAKCLNAYSFLDPFLASGDARIDAADAAACVALIAAGTSGCERPRGTFQGICPAWFSASTPIGEPCTFPICADGSGYCTSEGTCAARPGENDACSGLECAPGLLCLGGTCKAPLSAGAACDSVEQCAPPGWCVNGACGVLVAADGACTTTDDCAVGLTCDAGSCKSLGTSCSPELSCGNLEFCVNIPVCTEPGGAGSACSTDDACQSGFGCDTSSNTCTALPGLNEPCFNGAGCAPGLGCSQLDSLCVPLPGQGETCAMSIEVPFVCADPFGCNVDNTCAALPTEGQDCTLDYRCAEPFGCDFTPNGSICVAKRDAGGACENDRVCNAGLHCDFKTGTCASHYTLGAPCSSGNECGPTATCMPNDGGQFVCSPIPMLGQACLLDCAEGLYCGADATGDCVSPICGEL